MEQDIELIKQLQKGSYKAFNCIYEKYFDLLYGFTFQLTHSHDSARELVQETFIKVWIYRDQIDHSLSFKAWLYKLAQNHFFNLVKKQFSTPLFENYLNYNEDERFTTRQPDESFDFEAFNHSLSFAKKKLSPRQLEVFELCKEQGLSANEVAQKLNISEQVVYNYLSQALALLRTEMMPFYTLLLIFFS